MNRKKVFMTVALVVLLFIPTISFTQSLLLKHFSAKDGLPSSFVTCIIQDSQGYLWLGTEHGLCRFDGKEAKITTKEAKGLKNDYITDLYEDQHANLWIGTRGAGLIRMGEQGILAFTTSDGLPDNTITSIAEDQNGNLWIGTLSGLSMFNGSKFRNYTKTDGLVDNYVTDVLVDRKGNLWIGSQNGISLILKKKEHLQFMTFTVQNGLPNNEINCLMMDHTGTIWVGTKEGLGVFRGTNLKSVKKFISFTTNDGLSNNYINSLQEDRDDNIWIGTEDGVSLWTFGKFTNFHTKNGFLHNNIFAIFQDKEENLWFGTRLGISRLNSLKITNLSIKDGLPDNYVWAIIEDSKNKYWIGTDKGLSCFSNGVFITYTTKDGLCNDSVFNLLEDSKGNIWVATNGGLSVFSQENSTFRNFTITDGLPWDVVLSLSEDKNGTIWIGTMKGLCRYSEGKILPHDLNLHLDSSPIHAILCDSRGNLWLSDTKGLWKITENRSFRFTVRDGLCGNYIYSLYEDSRGQVWIGTKEGLSQFTNNKFTNFTTVDGLSNNDCFFVLEDNNHDIWIGTVNGLNRFNGRTFKTYTTRDGLISSEMNHCTCLKDSKGVLWFGTVSGITRFDPKLDRRNMIPPPIYITQFRVMEEDCTFSGHLQFENDENYVKISFVGLCYTSPQDVQYQYRLDGADKKWLYTKDPHVSYHALAPGEYEFKVIARNNDGVSSQNPATLEFSILPPYYETFWFRAIAFSLFLSLGLWVWRTQNKRLKERVANEAKNKQLVMAQRMKLMGILAGGAVHDLKNLLSIIIGYSNIVNEYGDEATEEEKEEAMDIIKNTAETAFHVVKQILSFTRQTYDDSKSFDLSELLDEILAILKVTVPPTMNIIWIPPTEKYLLPINPIKFKQVVMNLCLNAVQAMGDKGELKISLKKNPENSNQIIIEVSDTGPGIKPENLDKIFDPLFTTKEEEKGSGLGLFVVKQILNDYNGNIQVESIIGKGTSFFIHLPLHRPLLEKLN